MKVSELIQKLNTMPQDAEVSYFWDGAARSIVRKLWFSRGGYVVLHNGQEYEMVTEWSDAPEGAVFDQDGWCPT